MYSNTRRTLWDVPMASLMSSLSPIFFTAITHLSQGSLIPPGRLRLSQGSLIPPGRLRLPLTFQIHGAARGKAATGAAERGVTYLFALE